MSLSPRLLTLCLLALCVCSLPASAQLDGLSEVGHSYQSDARGGCEVSIGDTALAQVRQPASVAVQPIDGKFDSKITNLFVINQWSDPTSSDSSNHEALAYNLAAVHKLTEKLAAGVAFETGGWNTRFNNKVLPLFPRSKQSVGLARESIYATLARRINDNFSVGLGPHIEVVSFNTNLALGQSKLVWPSSSTAGAGFDIGALYHFWKRYQIGASYSSPVWLGPIHANNATIIGPSGNVLDAGKIGLHRTSLPGRVSFGISSAVTKKMKVAVEGGFLNYGSSLFGNVPVYGLFNTRFSPGYRDIWLINVGTDYDFNRHWSGSIGYTGNTNTTNARTLVPMYISNTRNMFTCGLRYKNDRWWTGFAYIIGLPSVSRSGANDHGPDFFNASVHQMIQSFNCGVGFAF